MPKRPHILIFNPDEWRGDVMGHMGNPAAITPNLDRLVETEGVSFARAFCQTPVCTPSRCAFMTGWYAHVRGHRTMYHMLHAERGEPNMLKLLRDNGYFVWWGGKNDLVPGQLGFDEYCDVKFVPSEADYARWGHAPRPGLHGWTDWRGGPESDNYYSFFAGRLPGGDDGMYFDRDWANVFAAGDFIRAYDSDKPLCVYLPLGNPHPPYGVEEPYYSAIDRAKIPPRAPAPANWAGKPMILPALAERQKLQGWTEDRWTELRAAYYGMCMRLDHQFKMVTDALREAGIYDETAIFFFSDHGDFVGDYGLVEKNQNTFEDALTRVPFVIKPPASMPRAPRISDAIVELIDLPATIYEMTGIQPAYDHFGKSLIELLIGQRDDHRDAAFCEGGRLIGETQAMELESKSSQNPEGLYYPRMSLQNSDERPWHTKAAMCRTAELKYVRRFYEQDELYNLDKDPQETNNIIEDPAYGKALSDLKERMLDWYMETCDVVPMGPDQR